MFKFLSLLLQRYHKPHIGWQEGFLVPPRQKSLTKISVGSERGGEHSHRQNCRQISFLAPSAKVDRTMASGLTGIATE